MFPDSTESGGSRGAETRTGSIAPATGTSGDTGQLAFSRATHTAVRALMLAAYRSESVDEPIAAAASSAAGNACRGRHSVEHLIIALKGEWAQLNVERVTSPLEARSLLARLVTKSIQEYFSR
jgi:hypothetical protein